MTHYRHSLTIDAPAGRVYDALTTPGGLAGWWTEDCDIALAEGGKSIFRFAKTYNVMLIEKLVPVSVVVWKCIEQYHDASGQLSRPDEWVGTTVRFELSPVSERRTKLDFEHVGLVAQLDCWEICERDWNFFLDESLKPMCETGTGKPFIPS